jgi:hypothetical protein
MLEDKYDIKLDLRNDYTKICTELTWFRAGSSSRLRPYVNTVIKLKLP